MAKVQNIFAKGIINKDSDARFVDASELIDAENFFVNTVDGESNGIGKNALGNILKTNYGILGKTVGVGVDRTYGLVYNLIKGLDFDYIIEYDVTTSATQIVVQSTSGTRLNFRTGERIRNVEVLKGNTRADSLLKFSGDSNPPRILNIARAKTWGVDGFTAEEIMLIKAPPLYPPVVEQLNTLEEVENFMKDKFISFATRYKYKDNYYSPISSWQEYPFIPSRFQSDYSTCLNKGMINSFNACDITFKTGPREVIAIDLLFRYSNTSEVYKVEQFIKSERGWADNVTIPTPIRFTNSKVYSVLPEDQYYRSYDNVPEESIAATMAGNRGFFANYKDQKNLIDKNGLPVVMDYKVSYSSLVTDSDKIIISKLSTTSIFDTSTITNGKIRLDFTGVQFINGSSIEILFNIKSIPVVPALSPVRNIFVFYKPYATILNKDYTSISALIADDASNGFKSGIEVYLSSLFLNDFLVYPTNSLSFPPSLFNGFVVSVISLNVIEITLPSMKYEIEVLPSGPNTFVKEYMQESATTASVESIGSKKSMKSYRSYEVVTFYRDAQGRKTTGLSSLKNNVFIPLSKSTSKNVLTVDMSTTKPPKWATTYKFAVKETIKTYEEIYITDFYEEGYFRWLRLEGTTKNKIKEGDTLLVKRDSFGVINKPILVEVLELKTQITDFISGSAIIELPGLYIKVKPEGFNLFVDPNKYKEYTPSASALNGVASLTVTIAGAIPVSSILTVTINSNFSNEDEFNDYSTQIIALSDYPDFQTFFNAQIDQIVFQGNNTGVLNGGVFIKNSPSSNAFYIQGTSNGQDTFINPKRTFLNVKVTLRTTAGFVIFEKQGIEEASSLFFETPEVFDIVDGEHVVNGTNVVAGVHSLANTFNCFVNGNGSESYQIQDAFNEKYVNIDYLPLAVSPNKYEQINRYADITYSGVYNANTNINKLNEYNLYLANFKEDVDKSYGAIYKIKGEETNLQVFQESKDSQVFYGKDFLFNADGSTNLQQTSQVLGSQNLYIGDFGISIHSDSYDSYGNSSYHTDVNRGVVIKKSNNGLFEISSQGMKSYFKKLFRNNIINQINGKYDQFNDVYVLNIKMNNNDNDYVTWVYSDKDNGWLGRITFNPEDMCCVNGKFLSFYKGEIYEHNQLTGRNTFYGVEYPSTFKFNFSQMPSERKIYKTVEMEATDSWQMALETDQDNGYINASDFEKQEGVYRAYPRVSNAVIDTSLLSCQGIGNCTVNGIILEFPFNLESSLSIGDEIRNSTLQLVGTIISKTNNSITLNAVANVVTGDFVLASKPQSIENQGVLGYHMVVTASLTKNTKTEVFAVSSEVVKSYT